MLLTMYLGKENHVSKKCNTKRHTEWLFNYVSFMSRKTDRKECSHC